MGTSVRVEMGIFDVDAKRDMAAECEQAQPFVRLESLREEVAAPRRYATLEPGRFVLDGTMEPLPGEEPDLGLWSAELSDESGEFAQPVELCMRFGQPHSCVGLTFYFDEACGEAAGGMLVRWLDAAGAEMARYRSRAGGPVWFLKKRVEGFCGIDVLFYGTSVPRRYLKLAGLEFGTRRSFGGGEILSARLLEEADPTGSELRVGQLELEVYSAEAEFSILNPEGMFYGLRQRQRMSLWGQTDGGEERPFGVYYLSEWESVNQNTARFCASDAVGLLESAAYDGGMVDMTAEGVAGQLLQGVDYALDEALKSQWVSGWLAGGTRRDALRQFAFALGAVVDTSRDGKIKLYPVRERPSAFIGAQRKLQRGSSVVLRPFVSGVRVQAHTYSPQEAEELLLKTRLDAGEHTVSCEGPCFDYRAEGAALVRAGTNQVTLALEADGEVLLYGKRYRDNAFLVERQAKNPMLYEENVLQVEGATLVTPARAEELAARLMRYYAKRYKQKLRMRLGDERLGDTVIVGSLNGEKLKGAIESMEIDLAGGFLAEVLVCGERLDGRWKYYTGELPSGGEGLI